MKALVAGWFSFELMGATAGDLMARDVVCEWLTAAGHDWDVAHASPFAGGVDWREANPEDYSAVVFVCGPFGNGEPTTGFLQRFAGRRLVGVDLSMVQDLDAWNPFDLLYERDSSRAARPDISLLSTQPLVPVVGRSLVHHQNRPRPMHEVANAAIARLLDSRHVAIVPIDTRLDIDNAGGLRTPSEIESLIAKLDVMVTTRLHGTVLALKNGVPAVAVDPIGGGDKVLRQARTLGWPVVFTADDLSGGALADAFDYCLTQAARDKALECRERALQTLGETRRDFISHLSQMRAPTPR